MNEPISQGLVDKIERLALVADSFAFFLIDGRGTILDKGGELDSFALPDWKVGEDILDKALFLHGYLPLSSEYENIVNYQLSDSCIIDVHLFRENQGLLVLMIDRSREGEKEAVTRQRLNEARLRQRYRKP